ncbi:hypothetical protein D3C80_890970 [compost metagenome]
MNTDRGACAPRLLYARLASRVIRIRPNSTQPANSVTSCDTISTANPEDTLPWLAITMPIIIGTNAENILPMPLISP